MSTNKLTFDDKQFELDHKKYFYAEFCLSKIVIFTS